MMNNQKDIQKTGANVYGQSNVLNDKMLSNIPVFEFANKKTEKLVTALYLVSDCMDTDDALKGKIRLLGVELLSVIYKLSLPSSPAEKHNNVSISLNHINEIVSFIEISYNIGFISEMNTLILKKEFSILSTNLKANITKDKHFTFTLDEKMFSLSDIPATVESRGSNYMGMPFIKEKMSLNSNNKNNSQNSYQKKTISSFPNLTDRKDRTDKIMSLIKEKKEVSIKDISLSFTDCSEKTIQRELNALVSKGQIKKTGLKRWSRYGVITN